MRVFIRIAVALVVAVTGSRLSLADDNTDWTAQFAGLDGVAVSCLRNLERRYTARICTTLMDYAAEKLKGLGIAYEVLGMLYSRGATPVPAKTLAKPLHLTVLVRATNPNPLGIDLRIDASVAYKAAVEQEGSSAPRSGHLLMWQNGLTGAGPQKQLEKAAVKVAKERMDILFGHIETGWSR